MKIAGIIAEYNPFHKGHEFHLHQVRSLTGADYVIVVMSGNFTQRGKPAIINKYLRTQMALSCGADLVLELPALFASSSAENFAYGGVSLLHQLGCVNYLGFGSECGTILPLKKIAEILLKEPIEYKELLNESLKKGISYPNARYKALSQLTALDSSELDLLSSPNNILGIEYMKALISLQSPMEAITITRNGAGYHENALQSDFSSALAIRKALVQTGSPISLENHVPNEVFSILSKNHMINFPIISSDFSSLLHYKLLLEESYGYEKYMDVTKDLSDKIKKNLNLYEDFDSFCMLLKSKDMTYTRICRCLTHILLNIPKTLYSALKNENALAYGRILGFRSESTDLLGILTKNSSLSLLSKASDAKNFMYNDKISPIYKELLQLDLRASRIYNSLIREKFQTILPDEFGQSIIKY